MSRLYPNQEFAFILLSLEKDGPEPIGRSNILKQIQDALDQSKIEIPYASYYVCAEGGMEIFDDEMHETAYAVVNTSSGGKGVSSFASFRVPTWIANEIKHGKGFGEAVDELYKTQGTKQGGGFAGILTGGVVSKEEHCMQALAFALASADKSEWYK